MKPYYEIGKKSTIFKDLQDFAFSPSEWAEYYNFDAKRIPPEIMFQDDFFIWLSHRYSFVAGVLKLDPYVCYDWHVDTSRGVCVNMLLNDVESKCLFSIEQGEITRTFKELKYKPETYYLFNNQVEHTVINFTQSRYLMSVEFEEGKDVLTFNNLLKEII